MSSRVRSLWFDFLMVGVAISGWIAGWCAFAHAQTPGAEPPTTSTLAHLWAMIPAWLQVAAAIMGGVVTIASALANVVPPTSKLGKALHWMALNLPGIQRAIAAQKVPPVPLPGPMAAILVAGACLIPSTARASCPRMTLSHGIAGTLYKASLDPKAGLRFDKVNFSGGYTLNENFLPNGDCSVRWISLTEGGLLGVGGAAVGTGAALNLTPIVGIGFYNSLVRIMVGYDALNLGAQSSGAFLGKFEAQNFSVFVGTGLNFDLSALIPAHGEALIRAEPPGWVRP